MSQTPQFERIDVFTNLIQIGCLVILSGLLGVAGGFVWHMSAENARTLLQAATALVAVFALTIAVRSGRIVHMQWQHSMEPLFTTVSPRDSKEIFIQFHTGNTECKEHEAVVFRGWQGNPPMLHFSVPVLNAGNGVAKLESVVLSAAGDDHERINGRFTRSIVPSGESVRLEFEYALDSEQPNKHEGISGLQTYGPSGLIKLTYFDLIGQRFIADIHFGRGQRTGMYVATSLPIRVDQN